jgi:hypothetical protein
LLRLSARTLARGSACAAEFHFLLDLRLFLVNCRHVYWNMSINSRYTDTGRAREMAATSSHREGAPLVSAERDGDPYYEDSTSSSDEELGMAGSEADTRRLLDPRNEAGYPATLPATSASLYPQLAAQEVDYHGQPLVSSLPGNVAGHQNGQYGSVSSSIPSQGRNKTKRKRYRLPFLILLFFDCGLVIFLSIISYDSTKSKTDDPIPQLAYFSMDLKNNYFDLVLVAMLRLVLNSLLYLLMGWVTRAIMGITTITSAVYVPLKAYYCWPLTSSEDGDFQDIPILLILFISFVMPWAEAFFFEFKYLPAELGRLSTVSWKRWEFWLWPRALVRPDINDPPSLSDVTAAQQQQVHRPNYPTNDPHISRHYTASTVSLDFRTPMGSTRNSPIPNHTIYGERSCHTGPDEELPPISEEATPSPIIRRTLSVDDRQYKAEGEQVLQQMLEFTSTNNSWKLERTADGVTFHSRTWQGKKIWKAEKEMELGAGQLWNILYPGDEMPLWNPQCTLNESVYKVDEETDVVYSVTSAVGPVSSRDFVSLRQISRRDGFFISASVATTFSQKPPQPGKVRGENGACGYKVVHISDNRCLYVWILNTDLKVLTCTYIFSSLTDTLLCNGHSLNRGHLSIREMVGSGSAPY